MTRNFEQSGLNGFKDIAENNKFGLLSYMTSMTAVLIRLVGWLELNPLSSVWAEGTTVIVTVLSNFFYSKIMKTDMWLIIIFFNFRDD